MESSSVSIKPVVKTVKVGCTLEEAFRFFTADFGMWWPAATHSVAAYASQFEDKPLTIILEPRVSGRILERAYSGEVDRLFRRNVTGDSGEVALSVVSTGSGHLQSRRR